MNNKNTLLLLLGLLISAGLMAQPQDRWQQRCKYEMEIDMDTEKHQFTGKQKLVLYNNSPDDLYNVYYYLFFNAFQPGSMMDERSRTISDPDPRVGNRISKLKPDEIGYHKIKSLKMNGKDVKFKVEETILEVQLNEPVPAGGSATFEMEFESQVPSQIRRSGRESSEGIDYSMSQWYPKMCEYDYQGWHAHPYVGREFHGVWGDYDVKITLPVEYTVAGTGMLQNPNKIGHGYEKVGYKPDLSGVEELTWHFKAQNVHDFVWGADPDYIHDVVDLDDTTQIHFFYQNNDEYKAVWVKSQEYMKKAFKFIETHYGNYPYRQYSFIQGGDGGMEYPMATLITGNRSIGSLVGVMVHELMHTWFQMLMGSNEALYPWMDEGFTSHSSSIVMNYLFTKPTRPTYEDLIKNIHKGSYGNYMLLAKKGLEEPLITHSDHYTTNAAYGTAAYSKGAVFLNQLEYIVGKSNWEQGMLDYYEAWHFKHPNPNDFIRIMEKRSGLELDWYREYFVNSIHTIDYAIKDVKKGDSKKETKISLQRKEWEDTETGVKHGRMPMPIDLVVEYEDGKEVKRAYYYIPLGIMRGEKPNENIYGEQKIMPDWWWTHTNYNLTIPIKTKDIIKVTIDPSTRMADIDYDNNVYKAE